MLSSLNRLLHRSFERLEPYEGKLSCTVLRGGCASNGASLPDQILCFDTKVNAESFISRKSVVFIVLPEENPATFFLVSLIIQQLYRELLSVADEHGGKLPRRALFLLDEFGSLPKIDSAEVMFSAGRSRRISIVAIIQSMAQLEQNYGREGASIISDNCQLTIYGGFAPGSELAQTLSRSLGDTTVQSGSISKGKGDGSRTLQMTGRPLISPDELKALPKGRFIVTKTGCYPMLATLRLFIEWRITFPDEWTMPENEPRPVVYVDRKAMEWAILAKFPPLGDSQTTGTSMQDRERSSGAPSAPQKRKPRIQESR